MSHHMGPYYAFDLDGTLAHDDGVYDRVGAPVERMLQMVKDLLSQGHQVRIVTARVCPEWEEREVQTALIEAWCREHLGQTLIVQSHKTGGMIKLYDDRAVGIVANTGVFLHDLHLAVSRTVAAQRIENVYYDRTGNHMDPRIAEALAAAVLTPQETT